MEKSNHRYNLRPLPGVRRGAPGADAGCLSLRAVGDEELSRRALIGLDPEYNTAEQSSSLSPISSLHPFSSTSSSNHSYASSPTSVHSGRNMILEDVVQEANANISEPTFIIPKVRNKWSREMNEFILRTYLHLTLLETDTNTYLLPLYTKFIEKYPHMKVTRQRVGDQRRAMVC